MTAPGEHVHDVAVIGYGPVGMATAALLGRAGLDVVVLERYPTLYNLPRAAIFDDETMRTFDRLGIAQGLLPKLHVQRNYEWRNSAGELLIEHDFAEVGRSGWAEWYMMYQPDLEEALDVLVRSLENVRVEMGCRVTDLDDTGDAVRLSVAGHEDVVARWVVACDGGNSFTRQSLGVDQDDYGFSEPWMVCDFRLTDDAGLPNARQVCDPAQPISVISLGPAHHRFSFMLDSAESFAVEAQPERVWARVARFLSPDQGELIRVATYTFRSLVAHRWRVGRVLLAGDAAHQMPPFLGQGMCSGVRDAQNLAFKLAAVLAGAPESLLDTVQSEREPHVRAIIEKGIELGRVQTVRDPALAAERDARLLAQRAAHQAPEKMRFPGLGAGVVDGSPQAGLLMPQGTVTVAGRTGRFDEVVGTGTVLLVDARRGARPGPLPDGTTAHLLVGPDDAAGPDDVVDTGGVYGTWFDASDVAAVLWRPDFYVFGTAVDTGGVQPLAERFAAALAPVRVPAGA